MNTKRRFAFLILLVAFATPFSSVHSQEVPEDEKATCAFDIDLTRIRASNAVQAIGLEGIVSVLEAEYILPPDIPVRELDRVTGYFEFSESWESIMAMGPAGGKIPMNFYVQLHFSSEDALEVFKSDIGDNSTTYEHEGKTYYGPPAAGGEEDLNMRVGFNGLVMEAGTTEYVYNPNSIVMTDKLKAAWESIPADNIARGAIDIEASRELIDGMLEQFKEELAFGDPTIKMLAETTLKVIDDVDVASGYFDLDNDKMLSLNIKSTNEEATEKVEGVVNGLLFMAVLPIKNGIKSIGLESKDDEKPLMQLADQLKAKKDGTHVIVEVVKTEDYKVACEETYFPALKEWASLFKIKNDLEMVANAATSYSYYHDGKLPFLKSDDEEEVEGGFEEEEIEWNDELSWRVRSLQNHYQSQFQKACLLADYSESWDHENNKELGENMPPAFGSDGKHSNIVWVKTKVKKLDDVTDDQWFTIMLLRLPEATDKPWTHPEDEISVIKVLKLVSNLEDGEVIYAATYSGEVIELDNTWTTRKLKTYLTPDAGDSYDE